MGLLLVKVDYCWWVDDGGLEIVKQWVGDGDDWLVAVDINYDNVTCDT